MRFNSFSRRTWPKWLIGFGFWTALALLTATETYMSVALMEKTISWTTAVRRGFEEWYLWGLLSIGVLWLANRFPFERGQGRRWFFFHMAASLVVMFVYAVGYASLLHGQRSIEGTIFEFHKVLHKVMAYYCHANVMIYWMMIAAHHGWLYYQRFRERELHAAAIGVHLSNSQCCV